ncbi:MAG: helix-turn-helix domain-containing protein [Hyphomicrobium sp.]
MLDVAAPLAIAAAHPPRRVDRRRKSLDAHAWGADDMLQVNARAAIETMVTDVFGVEAGSLTRGTRGGKAIAMARQVAMYIAHVNFGLTQTEVGRLFRRDRTTVAHACLRVEIRRDDALFDRALDLLGWAAPALIRRPDLHPRI